MDYIFIFFVLYCISKHNIFIIRFYRKNKCLKAPQKKRKSPLFHPTECPRIKLLLRSHSPPNHKGSCSCFVFPKMGLTDAFPQLSWEVRGEGLWCYSYSHPSQRWVPTFTDDTIYSTFQPTDITRHFIKNSSCNPSFSASCLVVFWLWVTHRQVGQMLILCKSQFLISLDDSEN